MSDRAAGTKSKQWRSPLAYTYVLISSVVSGAVTQGAMGNLKVLIAFAQDQYNITICGTSYPQT